MIAWVTQHPHQYFKLLVFRRTIIMKLLLNSLHANALNETTTRDTIKAIFWLSFTSGKFTFSSELSSRSSQPTETAKVRITCYLALFVKNRMLCIGFSTLETIYFKLTFHRFKSYFTVRMLWERRPNLVVFLSHESAPSASRFITSKSQEVNMDIAKPYLYQNRMSLKASRLTSARGVTAVKDDIDS